MAATQHNESACSSEAGSAQGFSAYRAVPFVLALSQFHAAKARYDRASDDYDKVHDKLGLEYLRDTTEAYQWAAYRDLMNAERCALWSSPQTLAELAEQMELLPTRREDDEPHIGDFELPLKWAADLRRLAPN